MKKFILSALATTLLLTACTGKGISAISELANALNSSDSLSLENYSYTDSAAHAYVDFTFVIPGGEDEASTNISSALIGYMDNAAGQIEAGDIEGYEGNDYQTGLNNYGKAIMARLNDMVAEEEGNEVDIPYFFEYNCYKTFENSKIITFDLDIAEFLGGIHPMYTFYSHSFTKSDGNEFVDFIDDSKLQAMQSELTKGLLQYFGEQDEEGLDEKRMREEYLIVLEDNALIPLPACSPIPTAEGLTFRYQPYEISFYAAGTPEFTIPYAKVKPFLTPKAQEILADQLGK